MVFDQSLCFSPQVASILDRSKIRLGVVARLSGREWEAEVGILRMSGEALGLGLIRYGLAVFGSGAYELSAYALGVGGINVLARRICGVAR